MLAIKEIGDQQPVARIKARRPRIELRVVRPELGGQRVHIDLGPESHIVGEALADPHRQAPVADDADFLADEAVRNLVRCVVGERSRRRDVAAVAAPDAVRIDIGLPDEHAPADRVVVHAAGTVLPEERDPFPPFGVGDEDAVSRFSVFETFRRRPQPPLHIGEYLGTVLDIEGAVGVNMEATEAGLVVVERLRISQHGRHQRDESQRPGGAHQDHSPEQRQRTHRSAPPSVSG